SNPSTPAGARWLWPRKQILLANTLPFLWPSLVASTRQKLTSPSSSSTSPAHHKPGSGNAFSLTNGCRSCTWKVCAKLACERNSEPKLHSVFVVQCPKQRRRASADERSHRSRCKK